MFMVMYESVNERIKCLLDSLFGGNVSAMAKETGIKRTTINSIINNGVNPGYDVLKKIADLSSPLVSMEWLIRGTGDMLLSGSSVKNSHNANSIVDSHINIESSTTDRLLKMLEEKDNQINRLLKIIETK